MFYINLYKKEKPEPERTENQKKIPMCHKCKNVSNRSLGMSLRSRGKQEMYVLAVAKREDSEVRGWSCYASCVVCAHGHFYLFEAKVSRIPKIYDNNQKLYLVDKISDWCTVQTGTRLLYFFLWRTGKNRVAEYPFEP